MRYIGKNIRKVDAVEKVSGRAKYQGDVKIPGMLHGKAVRAEYPHARVISVDTREAMAVSGVVEVLVAKDIPGENLFGKAVADQPALCGDKVRFLGDAVALVIATSVEIADYAKGLVKVDYEVLPAVGSIDEALSPDVAAIHEKGNLAATTVIKKGDVERGFKESDFVVERTYTTQFVEHLCMDLETSVAHYDEEGVLTLLTSSQNVYFDRKEICRVLGLPPAEVRVIKTYMGAGFGKREDIYTQILAALGTFVTKRPVRVCLSRQESFAVTTKRHPFVMHYKTGVTKEGKLIAQQIRIKADTGAYVSWAPNIIRKAAVHACGPYEIANVDIEAVTVHTNNALSGAFRGFGVPQVAFAHESHMDEIAKTIGMDRFELRRKNMFRIGSITATGQDLPSSVGLEKTFDEALRMYRNNPLPLPKDESLKRGVGIATIFYGIGYGNAIPDIGSATLELNKNGTVTIRIGAIDYGQGSSTVFSQIAAEELNLDISRIKIITADTATTPNSGSTVASRQTYISGNVVLNTAQRLRKLILKTAAEELGISQEDLVVEDGVVFAQENPETKLTFASIARILEANGERRIVQSRFRAKTTKIDESTGQGNVYWPYAFATQLAEVDVDSATGTVYVRRIIAAHDVGKALNPSLIKGQIQGGVVMGMGWALFEDFKVDKGYPLTPDMKTYIIPSSQDIPEIIPIIVEEEEPTGPYGAKGLGEPVLIPAAPAIINAIDDAVGKRIYSLPATPEKIVS